jgi:ABC-type nickel/cobalt efflux system permease component RcnA
VFSFLGIVSLGFVLGMRHATDPDHVVAVSTIVSKERRSARAALIGVLWGLGHTLTIFVVGAVIILFKVTIPARLGLSMELCVGLMLILLGIFNLTGTIRWVQERFGPEITASRSSAASNCREGPPKLSTSMRNLGAYNILRPLLVGIVHGLAGSAAIALLVMSTIRDPWWAIAYLFLFGVGTIAGMMLITLAICLPFTLTARRFSGWNRSMGIASGLVSLCFGLFLFYRIGFMDGLFTSHATWTPH